MDMFEFYVSLRSEILEIISGVQTSDRLTSWDDKTPNFSTRRTLETLLNKYVEESQKYGVKIIIKEHKHFSTDINRITTYTTYYSVERIEGENDKIKTDNTGLLNIITDICDAINCAEKKKTRSSIRELLLRAILLINDQLLPMPMDDLIKKGAD